MTLLLSRRGLIAGGIAVAALPLIGRIAATSGQLFLYDDRLDPDGSLLGEARRAGLRPMPATDLGSIIAELDAVGPHLPPAIAGVTGASAFFIIAQIAQRRGLMLRRRSGPSWAFAAADPHKSWRQI